MFRYFRYWLAGWLLGDKHTSANLIDFLCHAINHIEKGGNTAEAIVIMAGGAEVKLSMERVIKIP